MVEFNEKNRTVILSCWQPVSSKVQLYILNNGIDVCTRHLLTKSKQVDLIQNIELI